MRLPSLIVILGIVTSLSAGEPVTKIISKFGKDALGTLPRSWKADRTGKGDGSVWKVVADESAPSKSGHVLAQTAASPGPMFNLCVDATRKLKNVEVSVQFKAVKGEIDQGGGIVWRYQDNKNYYVARMNPLEDNYRLYKVIDGKRIQLESAGKIKVAAGTWLATSSKSARATRSATRPANPTRAPCWPPLLS